MEVETETEDLFTQLLKQKEVTEREQTKKLREYDSLAVVLLQALYNNDKQLLNFCLSQKDDSIIQTTVSKLIPEKVPILLQKIIEKMNSVPSISPALCVWLKYLIKYHIAVIMTNPQLSEDIQRLMGVIESQTVNFKTLIKVKGKIDMLIGFSGDKENSEADQLYEVKKQQPMILLEEDDNTSNIFDLSCLILIEMEQEEAEEEKQSVQVDSETESEKEEKNDSFQYEKYQPKEDISIQSDSLNEFIGLDEEMQ